MQELVKATGVPKSTILFYRAQGLLPPPFETGPNSAVYDPACVERIRFIRGLQANHRLTLAEIRDRLAAGEAGGLKTYLRLEETTFGRPETDKRLSRTAFCRATGLQPAETDELVGVGLLRPLVPGSFDADDVAMGRGYREALAAGTRAVDLRFYVELGEAIVAAELALRNRATGRLPPAKDAAATTRMAEARAHVPRLRRRPHLPAPGRRDEDAEGRRAAAAPGARAGAVARLTRHPVLS